ncbi:MAG: glycosyltransferase family 2 protein [Clostridia bacterium]|nr:glycosyltransferase family 2 protein [Clostridia bacterium]
MNVVLIPAYEPDDKLIELTQQLKDLGFTLVVVDDGSGESYKGIFENVASRAHIVTLPSNCGKGAALKAGMKYIRERLPECRSFITCDADGQHRPQDVLRVQQQLEEGHSFVLTVRRPNREAPFRSKFGNWLSRVVYALLTNRYLSDNQSGLRGFDRKHLDWLVTVQRNNYDYEMNVLYYASKMGIKITTLPMDAIYIENNSSSHFHPIRDTLRIYRSLFALAGATLFSFAAVELLLLGFDLFGGTEYISFAIASAGGLSYLIVFLLNKLIFFRQTPFSDYISTLVYTVICYFVYSLMCGMMMLATPGLPLVIAFNFAYIFCIPLRYFLLKFTFIATASRV